MDAGDCPSAPEWFVSQFPNGFGQAIIFSPKLLVRHSSVQRPARKPLTASAANLSKLTRCGVGHYFTIPVVILESLKPVSQLVSLLNRQLLYRSLNFFNRAHRIRIAFPHSFSCLRFALPFLFPLGLGHFE
jgi:hypothetical protein